MTKRSRTLLFSVLIVVFALAVPVIVFYPQGYRFDFKTQRITQVGAFYFEVKPTRAQIYVDQERIGETSRFLGNNLSKNFLPQIYLVEIKKEGYSTWQKKLEIQPRQVTEAKRVTLFLNNINLAPVQNNVLNFWAAPNEKDILLQKTVQDNLWELVLWDTQTNNEYLLFQTEDPQQKLQNIQWSSNSNTYLMQILLTKTSQTFVQEIDRSLLQSVQSNTSTTAAADSLLSLVPALNTEIEDIGFSAFNNDQLLILEKNTLSELPYKILESPQLIAQNVLSFVIEGQNLYWMDTKGIIWRKQASNSPPTQISLEELAVAAQKIYRLQVYENNIFLETPDTLYWLNQETQAFDRLALAPAQISASPDGKKLALSDGSEILLLYLEEQQEQPARQKGEKVLLTRLSERIANLNWYNADNLIFTAGDAIQISEIDTRDHVNIVNLAAAPSPRLFWQSSEKILYIYSNNQLQHSVKLE